jgi:MarR family transcriptional regulator, organic hydroperoxide resistance regulator
MPSPRIVRRDHHTQSIGYRIRQLSQLIARRFQADLAPHGLTPFHWFVLRCLWDEDGLPVSSLAEQLKEVGGTMTGVLDRMEERDLINRVRDKTDRRVWRVYLTDKVHELEKVLPPLITRLRKRLIKGVPQEQLDVFDKVLDNLIDNATEMVAECAE